MRWIFVGLVTIHGLIHFMGFGQAFGLGEFPQLSQPITRGVGIAWLAAGVLILATAVSVVAAPSIWWAVGFGAVLVSQAVIVSSWHDARFGTIANVVLLVGVVLGFASQGPLSFRAEYRRAVRVRLATTVPMELVTEKDLKPLPLPVQRYLRLAGAVGQPRIAHFTATWRGRIRGAADQSWMKFTAEQQNFPAESARFFLMDATKSGLPVDVFHAFQHNRAGMQARLLSLLPLVRSSGPDFDRAETVTLLNDLCLLAPAALIDPAIRWQQVDSSSVRAHYTVGSNTVSAVLRFNEADELVDFESDDRLVASADGTRLTPARWSTPVREYRSFGTRRAASRGEGRWHLPAGEFAYIQLELLDLQVNNPGRDP